MIKLNEFLKNKKPSFNLTDYESANSNKEESYRLSDFKSGKTKTYFKTNFKFLNDCEALSETNYNLIIGRTGKGKTDLLVSICRELLLRNKKVGLFISEGEIQDFKKQFIEILNKKADLIENMFIINEFNSNLTNVENISSWNNKLINILIENEIKYFFFDNLSTLKFTNSSPEIESKFIKDLVEKCRANNLSLTALIHTSKNYHSLYEIKLEDARGNQAHTSLANNVYAFNDFANLAKELRIIKILKSRNFGEKVGENYKINYKKLTFRGLYELDINISENEAKRYFAHNNRQKLSGPN